MVSRETLDAYRRMTPGQRLQLTLAAIRESTPYLLLGPPDVIDRRFARLRQDNDARNRSLRERLAAPEPTHEGG